MENYGTLGYIFLGIIAGFGLAGWLIVDTVKRILKTAVIQNFFSNLVKRVKDDPNWEFKKIKLYGHDVTLKANSEGLFLCLGAMEWKIYP